MHSNRDILRCSFFPSSLSAVSMSASSRFNHHHHHLQLRRSILCAAVAAAVVLYLLFQLHIRPFSFDKITTNTEIRQRNQATETPGNLYVSPTTSLPANFSFVLKVLTYNRLHSLARCLDSLVAADYSSDHIKLHIFIDHFPLEVQGDPFILDRKLKDAQDLLQYADHFRWPYGPKEIHYRTQNAGLQGQWLEAWWPSSDHEFAFVVEDDMMLSPLYYQYLRQIIQTYYYEPSNYDPSIYGISLQRPRFVPGKHGKPLVINGSTCLFLYQLVGTWGQLLFPKPWKQFRVWYDIHKSKNLKPLLEGMVTTGWYHRSKEKIWTPWFIKFVHSQGYFNFYTHFTDEQALSVSYREKGVNTKREAGPDSTLIGKEGMHTADCWKMKPLKEIKRYDFCFHEVVQGSLMKREHDVLALLPSLHANGTVLLVNALGVQELVVRNWLCQFGRFGINNYVLLLEDFALVDEFRRKGHAVLHMEPEKAEGAHEILLEKEKAKVIKGALSTVQAILWILQAGYNVWHTKADTFWAQNPFKNISRFDGDVLAFADKNGILMELLYTKSSEKTLTLWRNVLHDVLHQARSGKLFGARSRVLEISLREQAQKRELTVKTLQDSLLVNVSTAESHSLPLAAPLLTGILSTDAFEVVLKKLKVWMLDDDLSCTGVFCR